MRDLVAGNDLIEAWRIKHPAKKLFTWIKAAGAPAGCIVKVNRKK